MGVRETDWQSALMRDHGGWTAFVLALLAVGLCLLFHYRKHVLLVRAAFRRMWDALEETVLGAADSVLRYFASRLELARRVARVEALLAIQAAITADRERLTVVDRAARRARSTLIGRQRGLGVAAGPEGAEDLTGLLGGHAGALSEPLVPPGAHRAIDALLPRNGRDARVRDALQTLARDQRYEKRWREEVPFTSLDALCLAAAPHARIVAEWDPLADAETGGEVARHVAAFARRQARSLHVALNFTGHEARDPTGIGTTLGGDAIVPRGIFDAVRRTLTEEGGGGRAAIPVSPGIEPDRAYYVVAVGGIAEQAVASLSVPEGFDVEKERS
jgi:hypothetical protein